VVSRFRRLGDGIVADEVVDFCWYLIAGLTTPPQDFVDALKAKYGSDTHRCGYAAPSTVWPQMQTQM
jgi:hypothetical protein